MKINTAKTAQTMIPNRFIDELMPGINGEYVKVYLYMLRHAGEDVREENVADALELTLRDVKRAIGFLDKCGAFEGIKEEESIPVKQNDISRVRDDDEFSALLYELQCYIGKTFTAGDADIVAYMYNTLEMPAELIEYLFEVCRQKNKTSLRYMEKVAQGWYEKGIRTVEAAKKDASMFAEEFGLVRKQFGIKSRDLAGSEIEYVIKWIREYRMPSELINEACSRTVLSTGKPAFSYADSILKAWKEKGIASVKELEALDNEHKLTQEQNHKTAAASKSKNAKNGFHNFEERDENLDGDIIKKFNDLVK